MAQNNDILVIPDKAQELLLEYVRSASMIRDQGWNQRDRFEQIDRDYLREKDFTEEQRKAKAANRAGDVRKLQNIQVPMVLESVENGVGFLTNIFLLDYPMFKFGTSPEYEEVALMWNTLVGEDQIHYGWAGQFNIAFRNGEKYNFAPIECDWERQTLYKAVNGSGQNGTALEQVVWEGNCVEALDPYNTIYDPRVPIHRMHMEGEFGGWIKQMTRVGVKRFLANLGDARLKNDKKAFESPNWDVSYFTPHINYNVITRGNSWNDVNFNWVNWANNEAQNHIKYQNMYTVVKLYARIMPYEFGIRSPRDQTPDIWKLIAVNGVLVYAQPVPNAHDYLPIVIVQPNVDNLDHQTKSQAENQQPFQEMVSALWNAKLASSRRRTMDRMLYNPLLVDPDHINSPNPAAKIPLRPTAYGRKLEEAVFPIPYHDENSQYFIQEANGVAEWGLRANGQNRVSVGQFQKGNKLQDEFETTMANAGVRERSKAIMWETFGMFPIKTMLKSNYQQFTPSGKRYNRAQEQTVNIDPVQLRQVTAEFDVGDGLLPIQKLVKADVLNPAFQYLSADPAVGAEFNKGDMFAYLMQVQGVDKLAKFRKPPEQLQYEKAVSAWQQVAIELGKKVGTDIGGKPLLPEDIQKIIGPMPQPPQQQAQQAPQPGANNANPQT